MRGAGLGLAALLAGGFAISAHAADATRADNCAGFPRLALQVQPGYCVARVADATLGLRFPRRIIEVAPGRYWLTDMGSWEPHQGRLLELSLAADAAAVPRVQMKVLASALDRPHGLARGHDGLIYVAEAGKIWRTPVGAEIAPHTVIEALPADGSHPLKEIVFGAPGQLFINVGSASDACRGDTGEQPLPCPELEGETPRAAVYMALLGGPRNELLSLRPWALGLRNSMALAFVSGPNVLLQGENSIDYSDAALPAEELNVLREGKHYGWPYCVGPRLAARGYEGRFDCRRTEAPAMLWPAHVAPLHMLAVPAVSARPGVGGGAGAGGEAGAGAGASAHADAFAGQLLVAWHGHRPGGFRIVSFELDARGRAHGAPRIVIGGWQARAGVSRQGAPTGLLLDAAGRLFVVEDRNRSVLMLVRDVASKAP
jgi:glucose/arabinose dehydrogenase